MKAVASLPLMGDNVILINKLETRILNILVIDIVVSVLVCAANLYLAISFPPKKWCLLSFQEWAKAVHFLFR